MAVEETVGYSPQLATTYSEIHKVSSEKMRIDFNLTLTEYCYLMVLYQFVAPIRGRDLADFLMLKPGTIWHMTAPLEQRELIRTRSDETDGRLMVCELTAEGEHLASSCNKQLEDLLAEITHAYLPESEFDRYLASGISQSLSEMRGHETQLVRRSDRGHLFPVEFTVFVMTMLRLWQEASSREAGISFTQFRVLERLASVPSARVQDVADQLITSRSQVSAAKQRLLEKGLVIERSNPFDHRSLLLAITPLGGRTLRRVRVQLDRATAPTHRLDDNEGTLVLQTWHARMYSNIMRHHQRSGT